MADIKIDKPKKVSFKIVDSDSEKIVLQRDIDVSNIKHKKRKYIIDSQPTVTVKYFNVADIERLKLIEEKVHQNLNSKKRVKSTSEYILSWLDL